MIPYETVRWPGGEGSGEGDSPRPFATSISLPADPVFVFSAKSSTKSNKRKAREDTFCRVQGR
eukprot:9445668-Karenia_brevis.AAC.1